MNCRQQAMARRTIPSLLLPAWLGMLLVGVAPAMADETPAPQAVVKAYVDSVLDGLVEAGALTKEQADRIRQQAEQAAQERAREAAPAAKQAEAKKKPKWYETAKISGYIQSRFIYDMDAEKGEPDTTFLVRRARTKLKIEPNDRTEVVVQANWAESDVDVRDAFIQRELSRTWRLRFGLQDVPFGMETPQSSSRRLPLERNWVTRRFVPDEKDTGIVLYYTTPEDHNAFKYGKKHAFAAGDFGNFTIGFFNGQGRAVGEDMDDSKHLALRLAKPFLLGDPDSPRYAEVFTSYYGGKYYSKALGQDVDDYLWNIGGYLAPDPFGLQAEYYTGKTEGDDLDGWYVMSLYRISPRSILFARYDTYDGRRKGKGVDPYDRHRTAIGLAYRCDKNTRLTVEYDMQRNEAQKRDEDSLGLQLMVGF